MKGCGAHAVENVGITTREIVVIFEQELGQIFEFEKAKRNRSVATKL